MINDNIGKNDNKNTTTLQKHDNDLFSLNINKIIDEIIFINTDKHDLNNSKSDQSNNIKNHFNDNIKSKSDLINEVYMKLIDKISIFKENSTSLNNEMPNEITFNNDEVSLLLNIISEDNKKLENELEKFTERFRKIDLK